MIQLILLSNENNSASITVTSYSYWISFTGESMADQTLYYSNKIQSVDDIGFYPVVFKLCCAV